MTVQKPKINTTILNLTADNFAEVSSKLTDEIKEYASYSVGRKKISTVPMCFDTETTTVTKGDISYAFMYMYQLQVGNYTILSRVREYMMKVIKDIHYTLADLRCKAYMGIANNKYEWSFLRHDFMDLLNPMTDNGASCDVSVYLEKNQPLSISIGNITVVDICKMTNSSLAKIGKDYCTTQKLKGDLDYEVIRNSQTPLTKKEIAYCVNDVVVGAEFMTHIHQEYTEQHQKMPLTATGIPRAIMEKEAYKKEPHSKTFTYQETLEKIKMGFPRTYKEYEHLMQFLFRGGYTHGNVYYIGDLLNDIEHVDYTSDYPAIMLQKKFPMSFTNKNLEKYSCERGLNYLLSKEEDLAFYCTAEFTNIKNTTNHSVESIHKCTDISPDAKVDNGRILSASKMTTLITEQDYATYKKFYTWDSLKVTDLHIGKKEKLPKYVIIAVINSYVDKKYNKDHNIPYASEKAILNSCYGCTVQRLNIEDLKEVRGVNTVNSISCPFPFSYLEDPVVSDTPNNKSFDKIISKFIEKYKAIYGKELSYNQVSDKVEIMYANYLKGINKYDEKKQPIACLMSKVICEELQQRAYREQINGSYGRSKCLSPFYGVWITAYARRRLLDMVHGLEIFAQKNDYDPIVVYCDTDSMFLNCHQDEACWRETKSIIDKYNKETREYNKTYLAEYGKLVENKKVENPTELLSDIGEFAWEPTATHFKQLGAKRYLQRFRNKPKKFHHKIISLNQGTHQIPKKNPNKFWIKPRFTIESTIAGLSKKDYAKKIEHLETIQEKFDFFTDNMTFNEDETSKLTPVYTYEAYEAEVIDEYGNTEMMRERCGQVLTHVSFEMKLANDLAERLTKRIG